METPDKFSHNRCMESKTDISSGIDARRAILQTNPVFNPFLVSSTTCTNRPGVECATLGNNYVCSNSLCVQGLFKNAKFLSESAFPLSYLNEARPCATKEQPLCTLFAATSCSSNVFCQNSPTNTACYDGICQVVVCTDSAECATGHVCSNGRCGNAFQLFLFSFVHLQQTSTTCLTISTKSTIDMCFQHHFLPLTQCAREYLHFRNNILCWNALHKPSWNRMRSSGK